MIMRVSPAHLASVLLILSCHAAGAHAHDPALAGEMRRWLVEQQKERGIVGVSAAVIVDGKVAWQEGFGYADKDAGIAMTAHTPVGIGSVTKTFTALAALQMQEKGRWTLDDPLSGYLPAFQPRTHGEDLAQVTLRRLITHTSGLPTDSFRNMAQGQADYRDVVGLINRTAMAHPPGLVGQYSNAGYNLLGHALADSSGMDYREYVRRRILLPLGMQHSGFADDVQGQHRSKAYRADGMEATPFELRDVASGGLYSSSQDMARYALSLINAYEGRGSLPVAKATMRQMFTLQRNIPIDTNKKGLGWFLFQNDREVAAYHSGSTFYYNAAVIVLPQHRAAAVILANTVGSDATCEAFAFRLLEAYGLSSRDIVPEAPPLPSVDLAAADSRKDSGYYAQKNRYIHVDRDAHALLIDSGGERIRAHEVSPGVFAGNASVDAEKEIYYFRELGPYHVLLRRRGDHEQQLGYRVPASPFIDAWKRRVGRYLPFGYTMPGFEKVVSAEVALQENDLPVLRVSYNTGVFTYPLVPDGPDEARTGGLGPSMTGDSVTFAADGDGTVFSYLGLDFQKEK